MSKEAALAAAQPAPTETVAAPTETAQPAADATAQAKADAASFAALAKREAQLVREREAFKKEQETYRPQVEAILSKAKTFEELRGKDPVAALKAIGLTDTEIFNIFAEKPAPKELTPEEKIAETASKAAEAKLKEYQDAQAKAQAEAQKETDKKLLTTFRGSIAEFIKANADKYEYCAYKPEVALEQAYAIIVENLRQSNGEELIDFKEAVEMAEAFFEEEDKEMQTRIKKRQAAAAPAPEATKAPERTRTVTSADPNYKPAPVTTRTRTLSNDTGVTTRQARPANETREQKRERLINQIKANGLRK